jgi:hypothetical protein
MIKRRFEILIGVLIFLVLVTLMFTGNLDLNSKDWRKKARCKARDRALEEIISGIVINSYIDVGNHNIKTVEFENLGKMKKSLILDFEVSGVYKELIPGDSIFKPKYQLNFYLIRNGNTRELMLDFDCDQP